MRVRANGGIIGPKNNKGNFTFAGDAGLLTSITALYICDSNYNNIDDVAISTSGGYIRLLGIGFSSGYTLYLNGVAVASTTFISSTEIRAVLPANVNGSYTLTLFNSGGSGAIWAPGITYSGFPSFTTGTYSNQGTTVSVQLLATGDAPLTYSLQSGSTLPSGVTLSSSGLLSGTVSAIVNTVYSFTVLVDDAQLQTTQQAITLTVLFTDQYFNSTVLALHGDGAPTVPATIEILAVAGGGGGGAIWGDRAGIRASAGGGAGGVIYNSALGIAAGTVYTISIGDGGGSNTSGSNTIWNSTFVARGGGNGAVSDTAINAGSGGSGGGAGGYLSTTPGSSNQSTYSGWTVYGNAGGGGNDASGARGAGGGGGAGAVGTTGSTTLGGSGGVGVSSSITGVATYYAGGGGGGCDFTAFSTALGAGGNGGGAAAANNVTGAFSGTPNTGGGGGGLCNFNSPATPTQGGAGGSGVTIIAYPSTNSSLVVSPGLTYTMSTTSRTGYKVYTFTGGSGTIYFPTNNNNTFLDSSNNSFVVTRTGTPTQGTFTPFSQTGWSGYFNGTTDWLTVPYSTPAFNYGTSNFTMEAWVYPNASGITSRYISQGIGTNQIWVRRETNNTLTSQIVIGGTTYVATTSSSTININVWTHIAFVRNGNTYTQYINGIADGSVTIASITVNQTSLVVIGGLNNTASELVSGYISNLRLVNGTAVYTANFTPSTTPLTAISGTSLLTLQSNYFKDNSSNNFAITATGTPSIQAFSPFAPAAAYSTSAVGGSTYFNGTVDCISVPANAAFAPGTGNFTVEGWFYATAAVGTYGGVLYSQTINGINYFAIFAGQSGSNTILITMTLAGGGTPIYSSTTFALNTWNHFAVARVSGSVTVYLNGIGGTTTTNTTDLTNTTWNPTIGRYSHDVTNYFPGYISNVRYIKGTALYTANFTPPTAPLTAVTNTSLLLNATNAGIYDATAKNNLFTANTAQVSTANSKFGGSSMFFNGTTDYLTTIDTPNLQLGTGDFTVEAWVYVTTASTSRGIVAKGPTAATTGWECKINAANFFRFEWTASSLVGSSTIPINTWTHVAVVRFGSATGNVKLYVNGAVYATSPGAVTDNFTQTDVLKISNDRAGTSFWPGYIDDLRITKGIARYTANFTPSAYAFQDQ